MKDKKREIPKKNYFILLVLMISVVAITYLIFDISNKYQERKLQSSFLTNYVNEVSLNDLKNVLTEPNSELFILLTKTNNEEIYDLEVNLKKVIKKRDLRDNFIFMDYTDNNNLNEVNKLLKSDVKELPAIVYLKNGEFVKFIDSRVTMITYDEFEKMLDEYEVN